MDDEMNINKLKVVIVQKIYHIIRM